MQRDLVPDLFLGEIEQARQHDQIDHDLEAEPLALVELRLRRPHQERGNILGILLKRRWEAIVIGHLAGAQRRRDGPDKHVY